MRQSLSPSALGDWVMARGVPTMRAYLLPPLDDKETRPQQGGDTLCPRSHSRGRGAWVSGGAVIHHIGG